MNSDEGDNQKVTPAYVPYKTFSNFVEGLSQGIPSHIDRSVMPSLSGSAQAQLLSALKSLKLIEDDGNVTERLRVLVCADSENKRSALREMLQASYPYLFEDFDLSTAPPSQLDSRFKEYGGVSGSTVRRCELFFISAANEAGIQLSNFIKDMAKRKKSSTNGARTRRRAAGQNTSANGNDDESLEESNSEDSTSPSESEPSWETRLDWQKKILEMRLSKLPEINPEWAPEVQEVWFETLNRLSSTDDLEI